MAVMFEPIETLTDRQIEQLHRLYQSHWWSAGRALEDVRRMLAQSDLVMGFVEPDSGLLVAFCRILTDFLYQASLYDVIVAAEYRQQGIGRRLVQTAINHPRLRSVPAIWLCCLPELVPFYERLGFTDGIGELKWMRRLSSLPPGTPDDDAVQPSSDPLGN